MLLCIVQVVVPTLKNKNNQMIVKKQKQKKILVHRIAVLDTIVAGEMPVELS